MQGNLAKIAQIFLTFLLTENLGYYLSEKNSRASELLMKVKIDIKTDITVFCQIPTDA